MKQINSKKGILMTLGLVFVSLTLLSFANVIVNHSESSEERIKEFGEAERLYNLDNSVSRALSGMVQRGMNGTHNISVDGNKITIRTQFSNETPSFEKEIIDQFMIFKNRTGKDQSIDFDLRYPFLGANDFPISISNNFEVKNSSRFYLSNNLSLYVDITTWPENMIYLNGFDETNTESINITMWSQDTKLYAAERNLSHTFGSGTCPGDCINVDVTTVYQNTPDLVSFELKRILVGENSYLEGVFNLNLTREAAWGGDNITLAASWINSSYSSTVYPYWNETQEGLAITLPDLANIAGCELPPNPNPGGAYRQLYFGPLGTHPQDHCLQENIEVIVEVKLKGEVAEHNVHFVGAPSYNINPPLLDTSGGGIGLKYLD